MATDLKTSLLDALYGSPGYSTKLRLTAGELGQLRRMITDQYRARLVSLRPDLSELINETPIARYHTISHLFDHSSAWPKVERILPDQAVAEIRGFGFMRQIEATFGPILISNEEGVRKEEVYWRLVRPGQASDVGPVHADKWFWDLGHGVMPAGYERVKIWIPVQTEPGKSGLLLFPDSHLRDDFRYNVSHAGLYPKPSLASDLTNEPRVLFSGSDGELVTFHDRLLHGGALNTGEFTRVSTEMTVLVRSEAAS